MSYTLQRLAHVVVRNMEPASCIGVAEMFIDFTTEDAMRDRSNAEWMTMAATVAASAATIGAVAYAVGSRRKSGDATDGSSRSDGDDAVGQETHSSGAVTHDQDIERRIRRRLERVCENPHSIDVECEDGIATLYGDALEREIDDIVTSIAVVPGVREVRNQLDLHAHSLPSFAHEHTQDSSAGTWIRLAAGATGAGLLAWALDRRDLSGALAAALGGACLGSALPELQTDRVSRWAARTERRLSSQTPSDIARTGADENRSSDPLIPSSTHGFGTPTRH